MSSKIIMEEMDREEISAIDLESDRISTHDIRRPKAFAAMFMASLGVCLLGIIAVNWIGNGKEVFFSPLCPTNTERAWKTRRIIEAVQRGTPPQVLMLGSSRMMEIQPEYIRAITGKRTFNYAVSSATPVDYLAQLRFALRAHAKPDMIILGIDEFVFCNTSVPDLRLLGQKELFVEVPFPENLNIIGRSLEGITIKDTACSLLNLTRLGRRPSRSLGEVDSVLIEDGYLVQIEKEKKKAAKKYDLLQAMEITEIYYNEAYGISKSNHPFRNLSLRRIELFREFLDLAHSNGIDVRVMLLPLHPVFEERIFSQELQEIRQKLDDFLRECCGQRGIPYRNFSKLESFCGDPNEFWDGSHQTPINLCRMVNALFDLDPRKEVVRLPTNLEIANHLPAVTTLKTL